MAVLGLASWEQGERGSRGVHATGVGGARRWPVCCVLTPACWRCAGAEGLLNIYALNEHPMLVDQNNKDFASSVQIPVKRGLWDDPYSRT